MRAPRSWVSAAALSALAGTAHGQSLPPNFADQSVVSTWDQAVGVTFAADGRGFVWERGGRVWLVENGVKSAQPLIDISEEVGNWGDYGLLGFAIDPNFYSNGHIYLLYVVDYHHLRYFGTPQYNPAVSTDFHDTIGRLTRYTCNAAGGFRTVNYASRLVLVGESMSTGFPITHDSHGIGTLLFGEDGSLLASCGDGVTYNEVAVGGNQWGSSNTALSDGIITSIEDVGAFRSQLVDSLAGKIVRLDPATGNGLSTNPFFNAAAPRSPRSRVWTLGLRNPFRIALRPGTGNPKLSAGDPGTLYVPDVGWTQHERLTVAQGPGENFGWPAFEGLSVEPLYWDAAPLNRMAPNPLSGGQCPQFFKFTDLIVPPTTGAPSWPNPCNPAQQIPSSIPRFVFKAPAIEWGHGRTVRVGTFQNGVLTPVSITSPQSPVQGYQFGGSAGAGAAWYTGTLFPATYQNTFFMGDYTGKFINNFVFDASDNLVQVRPFAEDTGSVVCVAANPADGSLYYIRYDENGSSLRRIYWTSNLPPIAQAAANPTFGPSPLTVTFSSAGSSDPENQPLSYLWDFGDGSARSTEPNPTHVYQPVEDITAQGTIVARIFSLNPPVPQGEGNPNPEVIRDGVFPPVGSDDPMQQYDTSHNGDQGNDDWIGYAFPSTRNIRRVIFQEGKEFGEYGGWLDVINLEYRTGQNSWTPVTGLRIDPVYAGHDGVNFNTYIMSFNPVNANGLRVRGQPGGVGKFFSVGELRVLATPLSPSTAPTSHTVTLTATDALNSSSQATLLVSPNNTPPQVTITSPVNNTIYPVGPNLNLQLRANITDTQTPNQLNCRWQAIFHHDTHTHAEPPIFTCAPDITVPSGGCDAVYFWEFRLTVTDPQGLATAQSVFIYPDCGCYPNCDASSGAPLLTANDFLCFINKYANGDEHYANCDASTVAPVLTANDFLCFVNRFAAGCS